MSGREEEEGSAPFAKPDDVPPQDHKTVKGDTPVTQDEDLSPTMEPRTDIPNDIRKQLLQIQASSCRLINDLTSKISKVRVYTTMNIHNLSKMYKDCHRLLKEEEETKLANSRRIEEDEEQELKDKVNQLSRFMDLIQKVKTKDQISKLEMDLKALSKLEAELEGWELPILVLQSEMIHIVKPIPEKIEFDPESAHPNLCLSPDLKRVRFEPSSKVMRPRQNYFEPGLYVLGRPGFQSGRHYWEVDVGSKSSWIIGVVRESVERKKACDLNSKNGYWALRKQDDSVFYGIGDSAGTLSLEALPLRIGVCLDLFKSRLAFYDADTTSLVFQLAIRTHERLFPFFCPGVPVREEDWCPLMLFP